VNLYLDTEFNDFQGPLISIALVGTDFDEFYESLGCHDPSPWVRANVMPVIGIQSITRQGMQQKLMLFLRQYKTVHIIADWPEDIKHLCDLLITGPGTRIDTPPMTFEINRDLDGSSDIMPHNALADARALMEQAMKL